MLISILLHLLMGGETVRIQHSKCKESNMTFFQQGEHPFGYGQLLVFMDWLGYEDQEIWGNDLIFLIDFAS